MECCGETDQCSRSNSAGELRVTGIPDSVPRTIAELCRARLTEAASELMELTGETEVQLSVGNQNGQAAEHARPGPGSRQPVSPGERSAGGDEISIEERAEQYKAQEPFYDFNFLVVEEDLRESLLSAVDLVRLESKVFDDWNLKAIEPFPRTALNFYGPPGTGKTLAAHALAAYIQRPILMASYGQVESKFVGDGSKNIEALFYAAQRDGAVLFIDEADSLLSRRLTSVTQGAEQAINSMRSQLLVGLEQFKGIVIFSTNLVENYDRAFETRVTNLYFPLPDEECRRQIWQRHFPPQLPLTPDVSARELARIEGICGRDIKTAVIDSALRAARASREAISLTDLQEAVARLVKARTSSGSETRPQ